MKKLFHKKTIIVLSITLALLILAYLFITAFGIVHFGKSDSKTHSDVAIVLGAATYDGEVSPVYRERLNHGIYLYENGYADCLILTGGMGKGNSISDAAAAKEYVLSMGVPADAVFIEEKSTITEENLLYAKEIMDEKSLHTAIIVSDPLHMKRAMLMAEDYGIASCSSPTPTTMYKSIKTKLPFLMREEFFYIGYKIKRLFF